MNSDEEQFKYITSVINDYLKLKKEIDTLNQSIKERKYKLKLAEESIRAFINNGYDVLNINENEQLLEIEKDKVKNPSSKQIMDIIRNKLKNNNDLLDSIEKEIASHKKVEKVNKLKIKKTSGGIKNTKDKKKNTKAESDLSSKLLSTT